MVTSLHLVGGLTIAQAALATVLYRLLSVWLPLPFVIGTARQAVAEVSAASRQACRNEADNMRLAGTLRWGNAPLFVWAFEGWEYWLEIAEPKMKFFRGRGLKPAGDDRGPGAPDSFPAGLHTNDAMVAFETMVSRDWDRFWRYSYRLCANAEDAEDLLAESLLEAFQSFGRYRGEGFDRWLFRIITTNRIDMARRTRVRRTESIDTAFLGDGGGYESLSIADTEADPVRIVLNPMLSEELEAALRTLPPEFRAVLLLCDVEQMEYQEIAEMLRLPIGTVRSRIHRARAQTRKCLEKAGWP